MGNAILLSKKSARLFLFFAGLFIFPAVSFQSIPEVKFRKQMIAAESAESAGVFDVNGDDFLDIVSGSYWYEG
ncbi:MAG: hypothetical protein WBJ10_12630, partial [Daejeonella sp.]|uniref:hypothetical protein n=1 Tax=Daejeonella sp. TaxID=2805397 RepID=UPI003C70868C